MWTAEQTTVYQSPFYLGSCIIAMLIMSNCEIKCLPVDRVEGTSCYTADNSPVGSA